MNGLLCAWLSDEQASCRAGSGDGSDISGDVSCRAPAS